jgi:hypothetical protein
MIYSNWHLIGTEPVKSMPFSFGDILNTELLYDMKQELIPLSDMVFASRKYDKNDQSSSLIKNLANQKRGLLIWRLFGGI